MVPHDSVNAKHWLTARRYQSGTASCCHYVFFRLDGAHIAHNAHYTHANDLEMLVSKDPREVALLPLLPAVRPYLLFPPTAGDTEGCVERHEMS